MNATPPAPPLRKTAPPADPVATPVALLVERAVEAYLDAVCAGVVEPLRVASERLSEQVGRGLAQLDGAFEADASGEARWNAARAHRAVLSRALEEVGQVLGETSAGRTLAQARRRLTQTLRSDADQQAASASRLAPARLFAQRPGDSAYVASRKALARTGRRVRRRAPEQTIPTRQLAQFHADVRMPVALLPVFEALEQEVARAVATIETLGTQAAYTALRAEHRGRRAAFFMRPDERADAAAAGEAAGAAPAAAEPVADARPDDEADGALADARAAALKLRDALGALTLDVHATEARAREAVRLANEDWEEDVARGGTFLLSMRRRETEPPRAFVRHERQDEAWQAWHERAALRMGSLATLLAVPDAAAEALNAYVEAVRTDVAGPVDALLREAAQAVRADAPSVEEAFGRSPEEARRAVSAALEQALDATTHALGAFDALNLPARTQAFAAALGQAVGEIPDRLPETVRVNELHSDRVASAAEPVRPDVPVLTETPRAHARRAIEAEAEALGEVAQPVLDALATAREELEGVPTVLRFNLDTALSNLDALLRPAADPSDEYDLDADDAAPPPPPAAQFEEARDLALGGLRRSSARLSAASDSARALLAGAVPAAARPVRGVLRRVIERSGVEEGLRAQASDAQREAADRAREAGRRIGEELSDVWHRIRSQARLLRARARGLLRRGREAVGVTGPAELHELGTVEAIAGLDVLLERLPAPYRHLFSLRPIADPELLKGRTPNLARLRRHEQQWRAGLRNTLVVTAAPGSGLTSLFKVADTQVFAEYQMHHVELRARPASAAALAARLARTLGLPESAGAGLSELRTAIHERPAEDRPPVVVLGGLEHLLLRTVGGSDLARDAFLFFSQTDTRVVWICGIGAAAWQAAERALPQAAALALVHEMGGLTREALEDALMTRHSRSGLTLRFETPHKNTARLRRWWLKLRRHDMDSQDALRRLYFDALHRISASNLTLALVYWLRSVDVDAQGEVVLVRQPERLSFAFLDAFDRAGAFALKAFLDHRSLTPNELAAVMGGVPLRAAIEQFERLGNVMLIEPMPGKAPTTDSAFGDRPPLFFATSEADERYRLRPVVVQPVMDYLRRQNVLRA